MKEERTLSLKEARRKNNLNRKKQNVKNNQLSSASS
jgi:hypothetical protein